MVSLQEHMLFISLYGQSSRSVEFSPSQYILVSVRPPSDALTFECNILSENSESILLCEAVFPASQKETDRRGTLDKARKGIRVSGATELESKGTPLSP